MIPLRIFAGSNFSHVRRYRHPNQQCAEHPRKRLKRFIGHVLKIKNQISENLYIFDSPDITWENEALNKLNASLKQTFDLKDRYRYIAERVTIIKEDLELFKDIMDHRESSKLEWIIILLILVEVIDVFVLRILNHF